MYITETKADAALTIALKTFVTGCTANATELGLSAGDLTEISGARTLFLAALEAQAQAIAAAKAATAAKEAQKEATRAIVAKWAKAFRADESVTNAVLAAILVAPHATPGSKTPPTIPLDLTGNADGSGNVKLVWKRNGNIQGTTFVIEHRSSPTGIWMLTGTTTKASFTTNWTPGSYVEYRVTASRHGVTSAPSVPEVLWASGTSSFLSVAA